MNQLIHPTVLIAGGAGFIGSRLAKRFHAASYAVTVIDGLLEMTGGRKENLQPIITDIDFIQSNIKEVDNLATLVAKNQVVIDCMSWTSHRLALREPIYDLKLNAESHLHLIHHLQGHPGQKVIYLGSRGQYGNPNTIKITEDTPMIPEDIQGIHKLAAESYYRVYANLHRFNAVSLRITNCFGECQPILVEDIGLIGGFIRDILAGKVIKVFGHGRKRNIIYVEDVADMVFQICQQNLVGFEVYNVGGYEVEIEELVKLIISLIGRGDYTLKELAGEIKIIDSGSARFDSSKLQILLGKINSTDLNTALRNTIEYFKTVIYQQ